MNLVGKIFTFLIFVMCIVFASFALMLHSAHKIWREEIVKTGGYRDQLDKVKEEAYKATQAHMVARSQWEKQEDIYKKQIKDLIAEKDRLNKDAEGNQATILKLQGVNRELTAALKLDEQNLANSRGETEKLRQTAIDAEIQRDKIWDSLVKTTNDFVSAGARVTQLEKRVREVVDQYNQATMAMQVAGVHPGGILKDPPTGLSGEVTALQGSDVEISLGYDDGIREGHRFAVKRPSTGHYIGDIVIYKIPNPNRAIGRPDKPTMREQIQKGDNVQASVSNHR